VRKIIIVVAVAAAIVSCRNQDASAVSEKKAPAAQDADAAKQPEVISVTDWTERTELFMEYPPLVAARNSRFAVHLTAIGSFKPLKSGTVNVLLQGPGGTQTFTTTGPSRPGIFGVDVKPERAGAYTMTVQLKSSSLSDTHSVGSVTVYADEAAAANHPADKPKEETIASLRSNSGLSILRRRLLPSEQNAKASSSLVKCSRAQEGKVKSQRPLREGSSMWSPFPMEEVSPAARLWLESRRRRTRPVIVRPWS